MYKSGTLRKSDEWGIVADEGERMSMVNQMIVTRVCSITMATTTISLIKSIVMNEAQGRCTGEGVSDGL